jgi:hypothetical protein
LREVPRYERKQDSLIERQAAMRERVSLGVRGRAGEAGADPAKTLRELKEFKTSRSHRKMSRALGLIPVKGLSVKSIDVTTDGDPDMTTVLPSVKSIEVPSVESIEPDAPVFRSTGSAFRDRMRGRHERGEPEPDHWGDIKPDPDWPE